MTVIQGGEREVLIWESVHRWFQSKLDDLGWFGPLGAPAAGGGPRVEIPSITWRTERIEDYAKIPVNTLVISHEDTHVELNETGSLSTTDSTDYWIEFFASDDHMGRRVTGDVFALARGQMSQIDVEETVIPVFDWRVVPVPVEPLFYVHIESPDRVHGGQNPERPEMRHWFGVSFVIVDEQA